MTRKRKFDENGEGWTRQFPANLLQMITDENYQNMFSTHFLPLGSTSSNRFCLQNGYILVSSINLL